MPIETLTDPKDPRLSPYMNIKDRDLKGYGGGFMAEGKLVCERLFCATYARALSFLTTPSRFERFDHSLIPVDVPVYLVAQELMNEIVGFDLHRGYLAHGEPLANNLDVSVGDKKPLKLMALSAIANADNMGGLVRNARAFGFDGVVLDRACSSPYYRKAIRVSVGAALELSIIIVDHLADFFALHKIEAYGLSPKGDIKLADLIVPARAAFVFGAEGPGLAPELMSRLKGVRIEMKDGFDSLNVAATSAIVGYHFSLQNH